MDTGFWQPSLMTDKKWKFPYRPAIVSSMEHDLAVHKWRKRVSLLVYPLMLYKEVLEGFPEHIQS